MQINVPFNTNDKLYVAVPLRQMTIIGGCAFKTDIILQVTVPLKETTIISSYAFKTDDNYRWLFL